MALHAIMISLGSLSVYGLFTQIATKTSILVLFYIGGLLALAGTLIAIAGLINRFIETEVHKRSIRETTHTVLNNFTLKVSYAASFITRADLVIPSTILIVWMVSVAENYGYTSVQATARGGIILMTGSLFSLVSFSFIGILLDRLGRPFVLIVTLIMGGTGYLLIAVTENPFSNAMFFYICLLNLGKNGAIVAANTLAADASPRGLLGSILGGLNTVGTLGIVIFLQICGLSFDIFSSQSPFMFKGLLNVLCGLWILLLMRCIKTSAV
jgi:MFS family permease